MPTHATLVLVALSTGPAPTDNPAAAYELAWTNQLPWQRTLDIQDVRGGDWDERLQSAQEKLGPAGGVIFFPPGRYTFKDHITLASGIIVRGAAPAARVATDEAYALPTRFEFPKYSFRRQGEGTPISTACKGIRLADPQTASNCGVVHIDINRGHIAFHDGPEHQCGKNRIVYGCVLRNAAVATPEVPDRKIGQHAWQRWTLRHHAAITVRTAENALIANNRLPRSGDDNFLQKDYILLEPRQRKPLAIEEGVLFDYDNRPGIYANDYSLGAGGGNGPAGTPQTHPWGFRKGIVIRDNYIFCSGRCAIAFSGDGTLCAGNVIRFPQGIDRWTVTGTIGVTGSSTNDNRAVQMRGYRWTVANNDYEVHRNRARFGNYLINDGEGLMHEAHANTAIVASKLIGNKGNAYLSIYKAHGIDGLLIRGNEVRVPKGIDAIYVSSNYNGKLFPIQDVTIEKNLTSGSGIRIDGAPRGGLVIRHNRHEGPGGLIRNLAGAELINNMGYDVAAK